MLEKLPSLSQLPPGRPVNPLELDPFPFSDHPEDDFIASPATNSPPK
jgi:hypothetical protein